MHRVSTLVKSFQDTEDWIYECLYEPQVLCTSKDLNSAQLPLSIHLSSNKYSGRKVLSGSCQAKVRDGFGESRTQFIQFSTKQVSLPCITGCAWKGQIPERKGTWKPSRDPDRKQQFSRATLVQRNRKQAPGQGRRPIIPKLGRMCYAQFRNHFFYESPFSLLFL